ncbi:MAG: hypothetical protein ABIN97_09875 [Ginsengibacter sp.]
MIGEDEKHRIIISRLVFIFIFTSLLFRFYLQVTPSHLLQPALFYLNLDLTYWVYKFLKIPELIVYNQKAAILFDAFLFLTCGLSIIFPLKRIFIIVFSLLFFIYAVTYNTFIVHHSHPLSVMMLITFPFWFKKDKIWNLAWEGMRYYICYIYVMSFIWKIWINNSFFYWNQGIASLKINLAEYIYHNPGSFMSVLFKFLIAHPVLVNIGNTFIFLSEGLMIIGFFTKKYDRLLILLPIIIHVCTYVFADVFFIEMLVLIFPFFTKRDTHIIGRKVPLILKYQA